MKMQVVLAVLLILTGQSLLFAEDQKATSAESEGSETQQNQALSKYERLMLLKQQLTELKNQFRDDLSKTYNEQEEAITKLADQEYKKLIAVKYKTISIPVASSDQEITKFLNKHGEAGWDCGSNKIVENDQGDLYRFFCKKRPISYIRHLPKLIP